jgi:hypothetical protein
MSFGSHACASTRKSKEDRVSKSAVSTAAWVGFVFCACFAPIAVHASDAGTAGFLSLRLGAGGRAAALGDAYVSLAEDATAAYWNPAGLARVQGTSFTLMHHEWLSSVRVESASLAHRVAAGTFGLHFSGMYLDEIQRFTAATTTPEGNFNVWEIAVSGAFGRTLFEVWDVGLAVKGLVSELDGDNANGWAVDVGARYRTKIPGLTFAAAAQNLGPELTFIEESFLLPATARAGANYRRLLPRLEGAMVLTGDLVIPTDGEVHPHFGAEYTYRDFASARFGYKGNYDSQRYTFGAGLAKSGYRFDYAFGEVLNDLGNGHKFAFSIDL